jgi:hypothetical protein
MSAQSVKLHFPSSLAQPRGADWAQDLSNWVAHAGRVVWRALEASGRARARGELQRLARLHADRPEFAKALHNAIQADRPRA